MSKRKAELLIALVSIAWGSSYLFMKMGMQSMGAFSLVGWRFGVAFIAMCLLFPKKVFKADKKDIAYGAGLGLILCFVIAVIMISLKTTSTQSAGFLVGTTVVFVPVIQAILLRRLPQGKIALGALFSLCGIGLLSLNGALHFELASLLCVLGALLYAAQIIVTSRFVQKADALSLGIFQLGFASFFGFLISWLSGSFAVPHTGREWLAIVALGVICSAFGFVVQPVAQKYTTPERTGILFSLEPVSAAVMGYLFLREVMGVQGYIGALFVLAGVFVSGHINKKQRSG